MTPVVIFAFDRPDTLQQVMTQLGSQTLLPDKIIAFSDGARNSLEEAKVDKVRAILHGIDWADVEVIERPGNFGCATNIIAGISEVFEKHAQAVIVEDDVLPARSFYESMTVMLEAYSKDPKVFAVGGYPSICRTIDDYPYDVILSPRFSCWGWATWADRWQGVADDLKSGRVPYSSPDEVPRHAGEDLPTALAAVLARPGAYWDSPLALLCLRRNWFHAITNYYLTTNIGLTSGDHGNASAELVRFMQGCNVIEERVPSRFPAVELDDRVVAAVRAYVSAHNSVARERRIWKKALSWLAKRWLRR